MSHKHIYKQQSATPIKYELDYEINKAFGIGGQEEGKLETAIQMTDRKTNNLNSLLAPSLLKDKGLPLFLGNLFFMKERLVKV